MPSVLLRRSISFDRLDYLTVVHKQIVDNAFAFLATRNDLNRALLVVLAGQAEHHFGALVDENAVHLRPLAVHPDLHCVLVQTDSSAPFLAYVPWLESGFLSSNVVKAYTLYTIDCNVCILF